MWEFSFADDHRIQAEAEPLESKSRTGVPRQSGRRREATVRTKSLWVLLVGPGGIRRKCSSQKRLDQMLFALNSKVLAREPSSRYGTIPDGRGTRSPMLSGRK